MSETQAGAFLPRQSGKNLSRVLRHWDGKSQLTVPPIALTCFRRTAMKTSTHARFPRKQPLLDVRLSSDVVHRHPQVLSAIAFTIAKFCAAQPATSDPDVLTAVQALAESYKTLVAGIVYEQPPASDLAARTLRCALDAPRGNKAATRRKSPAGPIKDGELFQLLVFLFRMGLLRTNGRPRSRRFIEFLRGQFPAAPELKHEESRIIVP